jgi:hypothetical protein
MVSDYYTYTAKRLIERSGKVGMNPQGLLFFMQIEFAKTRSGDVADALDNLRKSGEIEYDGRYKLRGMTNDKYKR